MKVASAYAYDCGTRGYTLRDGCSIRAAEVEAINKALQYEKLLGVIIFNYIWHHVCVTGHWKPRG